MASFESDSSGAVNIAIDVVARNKVRPIDPNDPQLPRLLELKRRLEEAKEKKKEQDGGGATNVEMP